MAHSHGSPSHAPSRQVRLILAAAVVPFAVATVVGLVVLWPAHTTHRASKLSSVSAPLVKGTVSQVTTKRCQPDNSVCSDVDVRLTSGPDRGRSTTLSNIAFGPGVPVLSPGDHIVVGREVDQGSVTYYFADFQRGPPLMLLALLFAVLAVVIARWRGAAAIAGLGAAWLLLVRFVLPALVEGKSPLGVALVASAAIMLVVLYVAHGVNARTTTALLGTLASLLLTGVLAEVFVAATHLIGASSDDTTALQSALGNIDLQGLLLAGILIGSLGVLNDVTVTQASAVWELHHANPSRPPLELYRSGMRIGRDHIASTVYTLVLAYAGAALPLLILFTISSRHVGDVLTSETVAEEIVRSLVGSIGLIASVPITTALAALVVSRDSPHHDHEEETVRPPAPRRPPRGWKPAKGEREFWSEHLDDDSRR